MNLCGLCDQQNKKDHNEAHISNAQAIALARGPRNINLVDLAIKSLGTFSEIIPSNYQIYLKNCKNKKQKFIDSQFLPNEKSLNFKLNNRRIEWKRIKDVVNNATLFKNVIQPQDVHQGNSGDCYFLAAIASIAESSQRIYKIFCNQREICQEGIYRFQVVNCGQYREVVIDDFVPFFEGTDRTVFSRPIKGEIWVLLIEKVWAKLSGSYGNISQGYPHQVLNTFLVAPCFYDQIEINMFKNAQRRKEIWDKIVYASVRDMPMVVGTRQTGVSTGFKQGHAYSLLHGFEVNDNKQNIQLLTLRNPWGNTQFKGKYNESNNDFWSRIQKSNPKIIKLKEQDDGIFIVDFEQFAINFQCLDISHDIPNYHYIYSKVAAQSSKPLYFKLKVGKESQGDCFITVEKAFDRTEYIQEKKVDYGYTRILVAKINEQSNKYEYVGSDFEPNFPDLTLKLKQLTSGEYIIMAETLFQNKKSNTLNFSIYSAKKMSLDPIKNPPEDFIKIVMTDHAHNSPVENRNLLSESVEDWTISKFLSKESGYGYIYVKMGQKSKNKVEIGGKVKKIQDCGFKILGINEDEEFYIIVEPGHDEILVFSVDFTKELDNRKFPPRGIHFKNVL